MSARQLECFPNAVDLPTLLKYAVGPESFQCSVVCSHMDKYSIRHMCTYVQWYIGT